MKRIPEKRGRTWLTGISFAGLAAALFGASTPLSKILLGKTEPVLLAGLLYLGSGIGLTIWRTEGCGCGNAGNIFTRLLLCSGKWSTGSAHSTISNGWSIS